MRKTFRKRLELLLAVVNELVEGVSLPTRKIGQGNDALLVCQRRHAQRDARRRIRRRRRYHHQGDRPVRLNRAAFTETESVRGRTPDSLNQIGFLLEFHSKND